MNCPRCGAIEVSAACRNCGLADEAERGYATDQITPLITSEWLEHAQVWEVLARPSADEPWTRLEGFDRAPLMKRAREIAGQGGAGADGAEQAMTDELRDRVAQVIWQTYVVEVGKSLPYGLADKLADAAIAAMTPRDGLTWKVKWNDDDGWWRVIVTDGTRRGWAAHKNVDIAKAQAVLKMREDEV